MHLSDVGGKSNVTQAEAQRVGAEVAAQWFKECDPAREFKKVTKEQLGEALADIVRLSKVKLAHSANQDVPIKFFHTARDDNNNLRDVLLNASTNPSPRPNPEPGP